MWFSFHFLFILHIEKNSNTFDWIAAREAVNLKRKRRWQRNGKKLEWPKRYDKEPSLLFGFTISDRKSNLNWIFYSQIGLKPKMSEHNITLSRLQLRLQRIFFDSFSRLGQIQKNEIHRLFILRGMILKKKLGFRS